MKDLTILRKKELWLQKKIYPSKRWNFL